MQRKRYVMYYVAHKPAYKLSNVVNVTFVYIEARGEESQNRMVDMIVNCQC